MVAAKQKRKKKGTLVAHCSSRSDGRVLQRRLPTDANLPFTKPFYTIYKYPLRDVAKGVAQVLNEKLRTSD